MIVAEMENVIHPPLHVTAQKNIKEKIAVHYLVQITVQY